MATDTIASDVTDDENKSTKTVSSLVENDKNDSEKCDSNDKKDCNVGEPVKGDEERTEQHDHKLPEVNGTEDEINKDDSEEIQPIEEKNNDDEKQVEKSVTSSDKSDYCVIQKSESPANLATSKSLPPVGVTALLITNFVLNPEQAEKLTSLNNGATIQSASMTSLTGQPLSSPSLSPVAIQTTLPVQTTTLNIAVSPIAKLAVSSPVNGNTSVMQPDKVTDTPSEEDMAPVPSHSPNTTVNQPSNAPNQENMSLDQSYKPESILVKNLRLNMNSQSGRGSKRARLSSGPANRIRNMIPIEDEEDLRFRNSMRQTLFPKVSSIKSNSSNSTQATEKNGTQEELLTPVTENKEADAGPSEIQLDNVTELEKYLERKPQCLKLVEINGESLIECQLCPFTKVMGPGCKTSVLRHEKCHFCKGLFKCTLCTYSTNNKNYLKHHKEIHGESGQSDTDEGSMCPPVKEKTPVDTKLTPKEGYATAEVSLKMPKEASASPYGCISPTPRSPTSQSKTSPAARFQDHVKSPTKSQMCMALDLSPKPQTVNSKHKTVGAMLKAVRHSHQLSYASDGSLDLSTTPKKSDEDKGSIKSEGDDHRGQGASDESLYSPIDLTVSPFVDNHIKAEPLDSVDQFSVVHKCAFCPFTSGGHKSAKAVVMKHQICHNSKKKFVCVSCNYSSDSTDHIQRHLKLHPPNERQVLKNGLPMTGFRKRRKVNRPTPTTIRDIIAGGGIKKNNFFKPKVESIVINMAMEADIGEKSAAIDADSKDIPTDVPMKSILKPQLLNTSNGNQLIDDKKASSPVEIKDISQLAPSLESIASGGRLKNVYHCRYCPFKTASCTPAGKVNLEKHERCHSYKARFCCSECTFSTHYIDMIKGHVVLHEDCQASIISMQKRNKERRSSAHSTEDDNGMDITNERDSVSSPISIKSDSDGKTTGSSSPDQSPDSQQKTKRLKNNALVGKYLYKCRYCPFKTGANYASKYNMERHEQHHTSKGMHTCEKCGFSTDEYAVLRKHKKVHLKASHDEDCLYETRYLPEQKPVIFTDQDPKRFVRIAPKPTLPLEGGSNASGKRSNGWDQRAVDKNFVLSCKHCPFKTCGKSSRAQFNLEIHSKCHLGLGKYKCRYCTFTTNKSLVLKKHLLLHGIGDGENVVHQPPRITYSCQECSFESGNSEQYQCHIMSHKQSQHFNTSTSQQLTPSSQIMPSTEAEKPGLSPSDNVILPTKAKGGKKMLEIPAELWWDVDLQGYACQWCDFVTKREYFFKVHLYCHQRKRVKFRCEKCGYGATRAGFLDQHLKQHHSTGVIKTSGLAKDLMKAVSERMLEKGIATSYRSEQPFPLQENPAHCKTHQSPRKKGQSIGSPANSPQKPGEPPRKRKWEAAIPDPPVVEEQPTFVCSQCPFTTFSQEIEANHRGKHYRMDKHGCPYCTYSARTRVYLEKHVRLHFTAPLQDTALSSLPHNFSQSDTPTVMDFDLQGHGIGRQAGYKQLESTCRFCDVQVDEAKLKEHESRHLVGCGYLNYITETATAYAK